MNIHKYKYALSNHFLYKSHLLIFHPNRYDLQNLPECDGKSIDAIRVVFPHNHYSEGMTLGGAIKSKGYEVFFQAANTLAYSDAELVELATIANQVKPSSLSIVDTFGAMYGEDLSRIVNILDNHLDKDVFPVLQTLLTQVTADESSGSQVFVEILGCHMSGQNVTYLGRHQFGDVPFDEGTVLRR